MLLSNLITGSKANQLFLTTVCPLLKFFLKSIFIWVAIFCKHHGMNRESCMSICQIKHRGMTTGIKEQGRFKFKIMKLVRHLFQTCIHFAHTRNLFINLSHGRTKTAPEKQLKNSNSQVNNEILFLTGNGVRLLFEVKITTIRLYHARSRRSRLKIK